MKKRKVKLVRQDYQPSKAEQEEVITLRNKDGSMPEAADLMRALTAPVEIEFVDKPRPVTRRLP